MVREFLRFRRQGTGVFGGISGGLLEVSLGVSGSLGDSKVSGSLGEEVGEPLGVRGGVLKVCSGVARHLNRDRVVELRGEVEGCLGVLLIGFLDVSKDL